MWIMSGSSGSLTVFTELIGFGLTKEPISQRRLPGCKAMSKTKENDREGVKATFDQKLVVKPDIHFWEGENKPSQHSRNVSHENIFYPDTMNLLHSSNSSESSWNGPGVINLGYCPDQYEDSFLPSMANSIDSDEESMKTACDESFDIPIYGQRTSTVDIGTQTDEFSGDFCFEEDEYSTSNVESEEDTSSASEALTFRYYPARKPGSQCSECLLVCVHCFDSLCVVM